MDRITQLLKTLNKIDRYMLHNSDNMENLLRFVCEALTKYGCFSHAFISLFNERSGKSVIAQSNLDSVVNELETISQKGIIHFPSCIQRVLANDSLTTIRHTPEEKSDCPLVRILPEKTILGFPIRVDTLEGVLLAAPIDVEVPSTEEVELFEALVNDISLCLKNHLLQEEREYLALSDKKKGRNYAKLFDALNNGRLEILIDGTIIKVNRSAVNLLNMSEEALVGKDAFTFFPAVKQAIQTHRYGVLEGFHTAAPARFLKICVQPETGGTGTFHIELIDHTEAKKLSEQLQEKVWRLSIMHQIHSRIIQAQDAQYIASLFLSELKKSINFTRASIGVMRNPSEVKIIAVVPEETNRMGVGSLVPYEFFGTPELLERGWIRYLPDCPLSETDRYYHSILTRELGISTCYIYPLRVENDLVGLLSIGFSDPAQLSEKEEQLIVELGPPLAIALHHATLRDQLNASYKALQEHSARLDREIARKTRDLQITNDTLSKTLNVHGEYLTTLSMHVDSLLEQLYFIYHKLHRELFDTMSDKQRELVLSLLRKTKTIRGAVEQFITFYTVDSSQGDGQVKGELNSIIRELFTRLLRKYEEDLKEKKLHCSLDIDIVEQGIEVIFPQQKAGLIIRNILDNAIKFTPAEGAIAIKAKLDDSEEKLICGINDTGIGISDTMKPNLFSPMFHFTEGDWSENVGPGLGLTLAHIVAKSIKSNITIDSKLGEGTSVQVHFKLKKVARSDEKSPSDKLSEGWWREAEILKEKKILIVDNEEINRIWLEEFIQQLHSEVLSASNGREALKILQSHTPDLILMDMLMPVMDGFEFKREIDKNSRLSKIPIIVLSAVNTKRELDKIKACGLSHIIAKPIVGTTLIKKIEAVLSHTTT